MTQVLKSAAILALIAVPVQAALPPCAAHHMVQEATDVVQIKHYDLIPAAAGEMDCTLTGAVTAVLRGEMKEGDVLSVAIPCEPLAGMVGPQSFTLFEDLKAAAWVELHLTDGAVAGYGAGLALPPPQVTGDEGPEADFAIGRMILEPDPLCV